MTGLAGQFVGLAGQGAFLAFICFLRVSAAMALLPAFGEQSVPARIRLVLALGFTAIVAPAVAPQMPQFAELRAALPTLCIAEILVGLLLGIGLRLFVLALEMAGSIAAQSTSLSQIFGAGGEPMPVMSHLLVAAGLALAVTLGLHLRIVEALVLSYRVLPVGAMPDTALVRDWGVAGVGNGFALAFTLACPFVIAALIFNLALGAINRAMPQLMVALVGAPALTLGALALFAVAAPLGLAIWADAFDVFLSDPFGRPE